MTSNLNNSITILLHFNTAQFWWYIIEWTRNANTYVFTFIVPPGRPLIHNERGISVETTLGPYNEGAKLRLTCSVSGGKPISILHKYYTKVRCITEPCFLSKYILLS